MTSRPQGGRGYKWFYDDSNKGVSKDPKLCDVIYGWPLSDKESFLLIGYLMVMLFSEIVPIFPFMVIGGRMFPGGT
jgi:hypothetical protein